MAKFLVALLLMGGIAAGFLIYTKKHDIQVIPKAPVERWVDSLPPEQASCVRERVGMQTLIDIERGKIDSDIRTVVTNAECGVVFPNIPEEEGL